MPAAVTALAVGGREAPPPPPPVEEVSASVAPQKAAAWVSPNDSGSTADATSILIDR